MFETRTVPDEHVTAPDGSEVRPLLATGGGSMVHVTLPAGATSLAVKHRTVEELWYCLAGRGEFWRRLGDRQAVVPLAPGTSLSLPVGTHFQFRALGSEPLRCLLVTMPPWPGEGEAVRVPDHWPTTPDSPAPDPA